MTPIGQAVNAAEDRCDGSKTRTSGNQEHDEDLIFDRLDRRYSAEDLPRHHAGQRDQAGCCFRQAHAAAQSRKCSPTVSAHQPGSAGT